MNENRAAERAEKRRYWEEELKNWKESGLTQAEYCRDKDLHVHQFLYWRKRIFPEKSSATLVELPVRATTPCRSSAITLVVDGSFRIEIGEGFDPLMLEQVVRIVSRL